MAAETVKFWWKRDPKAFRKIGQIKIGSRFDWFDEWVGEVEGWRVHFYVFSGAILGASVRVTPPGLKKET